MNPIQRALALLFTTFIAVPALAMDVHLDLINHSPSSYLIRLYTSDNTVESRQKTLPSAAFGPSHITLSARHINHGLLTLTPNDASVVLHPIAVILRQHPSDFRVTNCTEFNLQCPLSLAKRGQGMTHLRLDLIPNKNAGHAAPVTG